MSQQAVADHRIVSPDEWVAARKRLLLMEKDFTRLREELSQSRRELPWVRVTKDYVFDTSDGRRGLADLFAGRSQLMVYHFMFAPQAEQGCHGCSFWADSFDHIIPHLAARDVTMLAISRAPLQKLQAFAGRFGWSFPWVSAGDGDFNYDFQVSFRPEDLAAGTAIHNYAPYAKQLPDKPGISVFYKDAVGTVFHTYSCYERGIDMMNAAYQYLDLAPKGRDEAGLDFSMAWVRYRDRYGAA
ncbi:MAG TPA: thioredoxin family protein [Dongiaceae bacterium]|nr:thioredoxin family protein [Dongiaceae bacterium]